MHCLLYFSCFNFIIVNSPSSFIHHLCFDQLTPVKTRYPLTSDTWPYRGLELRAHRGQLFSIGLQAQPRLTHLNISEASFFARFLWLDAATRPYCVNYSSYTVNTFGVQMENGLKNVLFLHFRWFQSSLTCLHSCGPYWLLLSYSSQASEGYKLKAECLFLICLELLFSLYWKFWHIFRSSDKVTWCLEDLWLEQKQKKSKRERQRLNRIPVIAHTCWKKLLHKFFPWALNR